MSFSDCDLKLNSTSISVRVLSSSLGPPMTHFQQLTRSARFWKAPESE